MKNIKRNKIKGLTDYCSPLFAANRGQKICAQEIKKKNLGPLLSGNCKYKWQISFSCDNYSLICNYKCQCIIEYIDRTLYCGWRWGLITMEQREKLHILVNTCGTVFAKHLNNPICALISSWVFFFFFFYTLISKVHSDPHLRIL